MCSHGLKWKENFHLLLIKFNKVDRSHIINQLIMICVCSCLFILPVFPFHSLYTSNKIILTKIIVFTPFTLIKNLIKHFQGPLITWLPSSSPIIN